MQLLSSLEPKIISATILKLVGYPIFVIVNNTYSEIANYHNIFSNINYIEMCTNNYRVTYYFKFALDLLRRGETMSQNC
jgi:hypothetical protein